MISFLVTYYNQEKYVSRSLNSIINQNLTEDYEILVGDDGSIDNTVKIVKEYQDKYPGKIKLFIQERDKKHKYLSVLRASLNRINLLSKANGDYVCFLDGDDEYYNFDFIQDAIENLKNNPKIIGVAHNYIIRKSSSVEYCHNITGKKYISLKDYAKNMYIHVGAIIFRKIRDIDINLLNTLGSFDDNDITYLFLNYGKLLYKNIDVYNYYSNDDGICSSIDEFEMKLLNALDYDAIKKIIHKRHLILFLRYFSTRYYIFKNRKNINHEKYKKWKQWPIKNTINYKLFDWGNQPIVIRFCIMQIVYIQKILIFSLYHFIPRRFRFFEP